MGNSRYAGFRFIGVGGGINLGTSESTVTVNGVKETFDIDLFHYYVAPTIGYRYSFDFGLNLTGAVSVGYGQYDFSTDSDLEGADEAVDLVDTLFNFIPVYAAAEASIGYNF